METILSQPLSRSFNHNKYNVATLLASRQVPLSGVIRMSIDSMGMVSSSRSKGTNNEVDHQSSDKPSIMAILLICLMTTMYSVFIMLVTVASYSFDGGTLMVFIRLRWIDHFILAPTDVKTPLIPWFLGAFQHVGISPILVMVFISHLAFVLTVLGIGTITWHVTRESKAMILASFLYLQATATVSLLQGLEDNLLALPFMLLSTWLALRATPRENGIIVDSRWISRHISENRREIVFVMSGIFSGLAIALHLQSVLLVAVLGFYILRTHCKRGILKFFFGSSCVVFLVHGLAFIFQPTIYQTAPPLYIRNENWFLLARQRSLEELLQWVLLWFKHLVTAVSPVPVFPNLPTRGSFQSSLPLYVMLALSGITWWFILVGVPTSPLVILRGNKASKKLQSPLMLALGMYVVTIFFTFAYEPGSIERWYQGIPFLAIGTSISFVHLHGEMQGLRQLTSAKSFLKRLSCYERVFVVARLFKSAKFHKITIMLFLGSVLFASLTINSGLIPTVFGLSSTSRSEWPYPTKKLIESITDNVPEEAPLILGRFQQWGYASYLRGEWTAYMLPDSSGAIQFIALDHGYLIGWGQPDFLQEYLDTFLTQNVTVYLLGEMVDALMKQWLDARYYNVTLTVHALFDITGALLDASSVGLMHGEEHVTTLLALHPRGE